MMRKQRLPQFITKSIQNKLVLAMTVVVSLVMTVFGFYLVGTQQKTASTGLENRATRTAALLAQTTALPLWNLDTDGIKAQLQAVMEDPEVSSVNVYETGNSRPTITASQQISPVDPITRSADINFQRGSEQVKLGKIEITYTRKLLYDSLNQIQALLIIIDIALVIVLVVITYFLMERLVTTPLHKITVLSSRLAQGDYTVQAEATSQDEVGTLTNAFNQMAAQLGEQFNTLEQRVTERTQELQTQTHELAARTQELEERSAELIEANKQIERRAIQTETIARVTKSIASVQNLQEVLPLITQVISEQFGFYHVGIFLNDETDEYAILRAANSEGGQRMLQHNHQLKIGETGIVGHVVAFGSTRIALDTGKDAFHFKNPDLPETRSEMALPLRANDKIIGALDVQSQEENAFTEEDAEVLATLADQVSIAIQNARLFEATQKSLSEAEAMYRQYLHQEWSIATRKQKVLGYRHDSQGTQPIANPDEQQLENISRPEAIIQRTGNASQLAIPVVLRGEIIGLLHVQAPGERAWNQDEIDIVQAVADRIAISAENARLLERTMERAERERKVSEITSKIRSTNDPNEMIKIALNEIKQTLNLKDARIVPYNPPQNEA